MLASTSGATRTNPGPAPVSEGPNAEDLTLPEHEIRNEGVRGFFRGMPSTLIRSFPVNAATFTVVTLILRWASESSPTASSPTASSGTSEAAPPSASTLCAPSSATAAGCDGACLPFLPSLQCPPRPQWRKKRITRHHHQPQSQRLRLRRRRRRLLRHHFFWAAFPLSSSSSDTAFSPS